MMLHNNIDKTPIKGYEQKLLNSLKASWEEYHKALIREAKAEANYYSIKGQKAFQMKASGETNSYVSNRIKGDQDVNAALLEKLIATAERIAIAEKINITKLEIRALGLEI